MEKTTLYLPNELQVQLRAVAQRSHRSQAKVVRDALVDYLAREPRRLPGSIGMASSGEVTGAQSEDWLRENWKHP